MTAAHQPDDTPFDSLQFRKVLGHFPTGVTIVTGLAEDEPAGFTIGIVHVGVVDPPLVGFLPQVSSDTRQAMAAAGRFCVNVLRDDQASLCWRFAGASGDALVRRCDMDPLTDGLPDHRRRRRGSIAWSSTASSWRPPRGRASHRPLPPHGPARAPVFYKGALGGFLAAE